MNTSKRKKMYRMGLLNKNPVQDVVKVEIVQQKPVVVEQVQLPVALKELPAEEVVQEQVVEEVKEEVTAVVEKKKPTKFKKAVEEDKPSDV